MQMSFDRMSRLPIVVSLLTSTNCILCPLKISLSVDAALKTFDPLFGQESSSLESMRAMEGLCDGKASILILQGREVGGEKWQGVYSSKDDMTRLISRCTIHTG